MTTTKTLHGEKVAILVANGFCEQDMTAIQRALQAAGAHTRVVALGQGLVGSWNGAGWGLHFAIDKALNQALAADYAMLVIPGGRRSHEKLELTAHTKRFIGGFLDTGKPVAAFGEALDVLIYTDKVAGRTVSGPESLRGTAEQAGAQWSNDRVSVDANLVTGISDEAVRDEYVGTVVRCFASMTAQVREAA